MEAEQRTEAAYLLLAQRRTAGQIKATFEKEYNLAFRQTAEYIARARKRIIAETKKTREEHINDAYHTFVSLIRDPRSTSADKIAANNGIIKLLGLAAPASVVLGAQVGTDSQGQPQNAPFEIRLTMNPDDITG